VAAAATNPGSAAAGSMKGNNLNFTAVQEQCASKLELAAAEVELTY
jgi:hypothetical protein